MGEGGIGEFGMWRDGVFGGKWDEEVGKRNFKDGVKREVDWMGIEERMGLWWLDVIKFESGEVYMLNNRGMGKEY